MMRSTRDAASNDQTRETWAELNGKKVYGRVDPLSEECHTCYIICRWDLRRRDEKKILWIFQFSSRLLMNKIFLLRFIISEIPTNTSSSPEHATWIRIIFIGCSPCCGFPLYKFVYYKVLLKGKFVNQYNWVNTCVNNTKVYCLIKTHPISAHASTPRRDANRLDAHKINAYSNMFN